jgi:hypothetical protein
MDDFGILSLAPSANFATLALFQDSRRTHNFPSDRSSFRFYRSLRAVKVLLAPLCSTLTALAPRMGVRIGSRWKSICHLHLASPQHVIKGRKLSNARRRFHCQILPLSPKFGEH